jgi:uncharacterized protein YegJ (DUF2314 family)
MRLAFLTLTIFSLCGCTEMEKEYEASTAEAHATLDTFDATLLKENYQHCGVQAVFGGTRYWVGELYLDGDTYIGKLLDFNRHVSAPFKSGDYVAVARTEVRDWIIVKDGKYYGFYTLKVDEKYLPNRAETKRPDRGDISDLK